LEARIPRAIEDMLVKGTPQGEIMKFLTDKVGMDEPEARKWVAQAQNLHSAKHKKPSHSDPAQHMFG
jgi:hypothetical protein